MIHHKAFFHPNNDAIYAIIIKKMKGTESNIPNIQSEKSLQNGLDR